MKNRIVAIVVALSLSACTGTLKPIGVRKDYSAFDDSNTRIARCAMPSGLGLHDLLAPDTSTDAQRLKWLNCEMLAKAMKNFEQAGQLQNRNEWRDIPLIGSALTAAALVLFGERGTDGNLKSGEIDVIEGLALGTAGFIVLSDYLNPQQAANLLYKSAEGHQCLSEHGQAIAVYGAAIDANRIGIYNNVIDARSQLRAMLTGEGSDAEKQAAREAIAQADKAITYFEKQKSARELAPARLFSVAFEFGVALTKEARRQPQSLGNIQKQIADNLKLQQEAAGIVQKAAPPPAGAAAFNDSPVKIGDLTKSLESDSNSLVNGLPNLALLVSNFGLCKTYSLAGSPLPIPTIEYPGTPAQGGN